MRTGRPKLKESKSKQVCIRFTADQIVKLKSEAKVCKMTLNEYIRWRCGCLTPPWGMTFKFVSKPKTDQTWQRLHFR